MSFHLVGYFPKLTAVPSNWHDSDQVTEICSVSTCIASAPEGWINRWLHNEMGFFNTPQDALNVVPQGGTGFSVFAYRLLEQRFDDGRPEPLVIPPLRVAPVPESFVSLGFDIVTKDLSDFFECSPLSCNGMASEVQVNRYCLIDSPDLAIALAAQYSRGGGVEPGYYHVFEVLREATRVPAPQFLPLKAQTR